MKAGSTVNLPCYTLKHVAGFILDKTIAVNSQKRLENAKILIANTCTTGPFDFMPSC